MQVRVASHPDIPEIVRLKGAMMETSYPFPVVVADHPEWPPKASARVRQMMDLGIHTFFVIEDPEQPDSDGADAPRLIGSISVEIQLAIPGIQWKGTSAYIGDMYVDPRFRGQGLGRMLMDAALGQARAWDAGTARLSSTPGAVDVYLALGFHFPERDQPELFPMMWMDL